MFFQPILANLVSSSWLEIIIVGIVAGLLLNVCLRGRGYGFLGNTLIGLFGAIIGGFVWEKVLKPYIDVDLGSVTIQLHLVLVALLGAGLLIALINFLGKRRS
ncbi:MAG: hypothetical protein P1U89_14350 [Verrucomicrobiales bacterium]|nr:hypothetical protein [Verrucomicrobiales bacterium]